MLGPTGEERPARRYVVNEVRRFADVVVRDTGSGPEVRGCGETAARGASRLGQQSQGSLTLGRNDIR
jgi:hypothetical protein